MATETSATARGADSASAVELRVASKSPAADGVVALTLARADGGRLPDWAPGAHIDLVLPNGMTRQYSLCGDRWDARAYRIGVLREPDGRGGSAFVHDELDAGDVVAVGGPRNNFRLAPAERYLFIAGGIGITPLLPMIVQADMLGVEWRLLYGGRTRSSMAFLDELAVHGDRVTIVPQDEGGVLDVAAWLPEDLDGAKVYCCGPKGLLDAVEAHCAGLPAGTLRTERFLAADTGPRTGDHAFDVELRRSGRTVTVGPDRSLLQALGEAGLHVLSSCRQGVCGTCETTVLDGVPDHRDSLLDDAERAAGDCMFVCVSRSVGPRLVLDL
ncbi:PDR/VanB family oxidoreductase [Actinomadura sp. WMMB 499]|uniref:PDR/VanB family oxidoreductase n=1 Tax=Actinomadura sp. WMMB 499 TaxID=1219491 RepID=UPI001248BCCD|nr:PDR/VanB family oxidoreductase [Actinomadura sp. WMMB 499]QFG21286.1 oxidoreductase [Actinomadura sp. WMMB 499]